MNALLPPVIPYVQVGDVVMVKGQERGFVESVGLRTTIMRSVTVRGKREFGGWGGVVVIVIVIVIIVIIVITSRVVLQSSYSFSN